MQAFGYTRVRRVVLLETYHKVICGTTASTYDRAAPLEYAMRFLSQCRILSG